MQAAAGSRFVFVRKASCTFTLPGTLLLTTEFGLLEVSPGEVVVVQRGMRFSVSLLSGPARGYVLEVFQGHFMLPDLGPIGKQEQLACSRSTHPVACRGHSSWYLVADKHCSRHSSWHQ